MGGKGSGARRKPTAYHILHGSFKVNPSRQNGNEPEAPKDRPKCPAHLPPLAKTEWRFICDKLEAMNLLTSADRPTLELYCQTYSQWREASKKLLTVGQVELDSNDISPWFKVQQKSAELMTKLLIQFGFTPSARAGLFVEKRTNQQTGVARRSRA